MVLLAQTLTQFPLAVFETWELRLDKSLQHV